MKQLLTGIALAVALASPVLAGTEHVFENPCERGPVPHWNVINNAHAKFVDFLTSVRPQMPEDMAKTIAYEMCDDMTLVGDSDGLTKRLNILLKKYGY